MAFGDDEDDQEDFEFEVTVKVATDKALLCILESGNEHWVPRSLLKPGTDVSDRGDEGTIIIPGWFAQKEEMD